MKASPVLSMHQSSIDIMDYDDGRWVDSLLRLWIMSQMVEIHSVVLARSTSKWSGPGSVGSRKTPAVSSFQMDGWRTREGESRAELTPVKMSVFQTGIFLIGFLRLCGEFVNSSICVNMRGTVFVFIVNVTNNLIMNIKLHYHSCIIMTSPLLYECK